MTTAHTNKNGGTQESGVGEGGTPGGNAVQVTPFSTAAKGAALRRMKQAQQAMKTTMSLAQAAERGREEERLKKAEEEAAAAAAVAAGKEKEKEKETENEMEVEEINEGEEESDEVEVVADETGEGDALNAVVRVLDQELATPTSNKKRRSGELKTKTVDKSDSVAGKTYAAAAKALRPSSFVAHNYRHPRVVIEGSARLEKEDKVKEFLDLVGILLTNGKIVDQFFAIAPVVMGTGKKYLREAKDVPVNMTSLGGYIKISEKCLRAFERKNPFKARTKGKKNSGGVGTITDIIYFTFAIACDVDPMEVLQGIAVEWMRGGGVGLYRKEIQAFNTMSPFVIFYLYNGTSVHTLVEEFRKMLVEAMKMLEDDAMVDDGERIMVLPPFTFWKSLPKLPGLNPEEYVGLKSSAGGDKEGLAR